MNTESKTTTNHEQIKVWTEARSGHPARVKGTEDLLRIDFEDKTDDPNLERISWDEFFTEFEENNLAFLFQDRTADGQMSRFFKFVKRE